MATRTDLYPAIEPYGFGLLDVDPPHRLYWEQCGNPRGAPALFLHGGPGSGSTPTHRRFFDPAFYRIVLFDQRGAGRSVPFASIERNTTPDLIADIERLRVALGIERWLIFGGSWGSTLALAYGLAHPERCLGFILRGIFLCQPSEIAWFLTGMATIFPEAAEAFRGFLPEAERHDLLASYYSRLNAPERTVQLAASRAWSAYENACSSLLPGPDPAPSGPHEQGSLALARIEAHYMTHGGFLSEHFPFDGLDRIRHLPTTIVQGRYDVVCPIMTAHRLHQAWPEARYVVVPDAGHSALEPGIRVRLVQATERAKRLVPS